MHPPSSSVHVLHAKSLSQNLIQSSSDAYIMYGSYHLEQTANKKYLCSWKSEQTRRVKSNHICLAMYDQTDVC
jgi:hypothetical protein